MHRVGPRSAESFVMSTVLQVIADLLPHHTPGSEEAVDQAPYARRGESGANPIG